MTMDWLRYISFRLYCSFLAYWSPPPLVDSDESDVEETPRVMRVYQTMTPYPTPSTSPELQDEEEEWEKVE
jgi:hypothetical protein